MGNIGLVKVSGALLLLGGAIFGVGFIIHDVGDVPWLRGVPDDPGQWLLDVDRKRSAVVAEAWFKLVPLLLFMGATLGIYQALRQAGPLLWIAVVASVTGVLLVIAQRLVVLGVAYELAPAYAEASEAVRPSLEVMATTLMRIGVLAEALADHLIAPIGTALFAVAILRTSVMPRWLGWLGLAVALLRWQGWLDPISDVFRGFSYVGFIALGVSVVAMGVIMLRLREPAADTAEP